MEALRPFLNEQLDFVLKIHDKACAAIRTVDAHNLDQSNILIEIISGMIRVRASCRTIDRNLKYLLVKTSD